MVAHYDTVSKSPGGDDNASGVAVLLELATVMKLMLFERTVQLIAVNLEEKQQRRPTRRDSPVREPRIGRLRQERRLEDRRCCGPRISCLRW